MRKKTYICFWGFLVATSACGVPQAQVVINEVTASGDDQIELYNVSDAPVDLAGWALTDETPESPGHRFTFLARSELPAQSYWVLVKGIDHSFSLGKDNEVRLLDANGLVVDVADYGPGEATISYCRMPNGTGFFEACLEQTIGRSNDPRSAVVN